MLLDTTVTAAADSGTWRDVADAGQVWRRLGTAIDAAGLPDPSMIEVNRDTWAAVIWLQRHTDADLAVWVHWLGAGGTTTQIHENPPLYPCHVLREVSTSSRWRSWTITVRLLQVLPRIGGAR